MIGMGMEMRKKCVEMGTVCGDGDVTLYSLPAHMRQTKLTHFGHAAQSVMNT